MRNVAVVFQQRARKLEHAIMAGWFGVVREDLDRCRRRIVGLVCQCGDSILARHSR